MLWNIWFANCHYESIIFERSVCLTHQSGFTKRQNSVKKKSFKFNILKMSQFAVWLVIFFCFFFLMLCDMPKISNQIGRVTKETKCKRTCETATRAMLREGVKTNRCSSTDDELTSSMANVDSDFSFTFSLLLS